MSENGAAGQAAQVKDTATTQAGQVKDTATAEAGHVAGVAKDEAARVAREASSEVRDLLGRTGSELKDQAGQQQQRAASGLHTLSDELGRMASSQDTPGVASDLVGQAASRVGAIGDWLEGRDPGSLLEEVKSFARRKPGTFIAIAGVAGVLAGRLTRSLASGGSDSGSTGSSSGSTPAAGLGGTGYEYNPADTVAPVTPAVVPPVVPAEETSVYTEEAVVFTEEPPAYEETPVYTERIHAQGDEGLRP